MASPRKDSRKERGNLAGNNTRPRKLWIRVFDYFVPLQSIFPCSKLLTAPGPQHLISARLRAVQHSVNFPTTRDKLLKIPRRVFLQSFPVLGQIYVLISLLFLFL